MGKSDVVILQYVLALSASWSLLKMITYVKMRQNNFFSWNETIQLFHPSTRRKPVLQ